MLLSSIRRLRTHVMGMQSAPLTTSTDNDRLLKMWLVTVSRMIEKYLDRDLEIGDKVEYYTLSSRRKQFWIKAPPVISLRDVFVDLEGLYVGRESDIPNCFPDEFLNSIRFPYAYWMEWTGTKAIRVRYRGGLASHAVNEAFTITAGYTGTFTAGQFVGGSSSGACGIVKSFDAGTRLLSIENYYGIFELGETLTQTHQEASGSVTASGVIEALSTLSLVTVAPEIVTATEAQVRYMWKHTTDFENIGSMKDGTTQRATQRAPVMANHEWPLTPEVREMLNPYRRVAVM